VNLERRFIMSESKKVLVVDDETDIRYLLSDFLSSKGFEVSLAKDVRNRLINWRTRVLTWSLQISVCRGWMGSRC